MSMSTNEDSYNLFSKKEDARELIKIQIIKTKPSKFN